jgi:hypothetical protein
MPRDRDALGRARNSRPRDATGRPLPRGAAGVEQLPDDLALGSAESVDEAQSLLDADRPFAAHEVLEAVWKSAPVGERELWRGLAQLAVGLTHVQRGNARGAAALLARAADRLATWVGDVPDGIDRTGLVRAAESLAARIEVQGLGGLTPLDLRVRLRA